MFTVQLIQYICRSTFNIIILVDSSVFVVAVADFVTSLEQTFHSSTCIHQTTPLFLMQNCFYIFDVICIGCWMEINHLHMNFFLTELKL